MRARPVALLALSLLVLPACASDGPETPAKPDRRATTTSTSGASTSVATTVPFDGTTEATTSVATTDTTALLRSVTVTTAAGVDRVTFQFEGAGIPGLRLEYVDQPTADGSGEPVTVEGAAALQVRFEPSATADLRGESLRRVYTGPDRVKGDSRVVTEVVKGGDFEGVLTWFVGTRSEARFRIVALHTAPSSVTVELAA